MQQRAGSIAALEHTQWATKAIVFRVHLEWIARMQEARFRVLGGGIRQAAWHVLSVRKGQLAPVRIRHLNCALQDPTLHSLLRPCALHVQQGPNVRGQA